MPSRWKVTGLSTAGMRCRIGVIADDLTGASDAGVQFRKAGLASTVLIQREAAVEALVRADVVVIDTNSRHLDPDEAYGEARQAASLFSQHGITRVYKKVDSTLRGNIGAEIDGVMDAVGAELCVLAPAFPANGRTTLNGRQFVAGVPIEEAEAGEDILSPARLSHVPSIVARQSARKVMSICLEEIRKGEHVLAARLPGLVSDGNRIIVMDAEDQDDLRRIAEALELSGLSYVAAGSAGFAAEFSRAVCTDSRPPEAWATRSRGGILLVVGSATRTSAEQVSVAAQEPLVGSVQIEMGFGMPGRACDLDVDKAIRAVHAELEDGHDVIVSMARPGMPVGGPEDSVFVRDCLARIARAAVLSNLVYGVVLTGGDTAIAVLEALGAIGLDVHQEVLPGIPLGFMVGGEAGGMPVVTKAGGFGDADALAVAIRRLRLEHARCQR